MNSVYDPHPLHLYVYLDDLYHACSQKKIVRIQAWQHLLVHLGIEVILCCTQSQSCPASLPWLPWQIQCDPSGRQAADRNMTATRTVFGKTQITHVSGMELFDGPQCLLHRQQINHKAMEACCQKALQCQQKWLTENMKELIDMQV